jgi:predicted transposase YbfD/YdcC
LENTHTHPKEATMKFATSRPPPPIEMPGALLFDVGSLARQLETLSDPRHRRGIRFQLPILLLLVVLAKLAGEDRPSGIADWVRLRKDQFCAALQLAWRAMPHANTFRRILADVVSPSELDGCLQEFFGHLPAVGHSVLIAIDGKTIRGTISADQPRGEHLLCAYLPEEGIVLFQVAAGHKENEISVAPTLLAALDLRGKVVMGDAMHTQRALSLQILAAGGDYVWIAKDNQPTLRDDIAQVFAPSDPTPEGGRFASEGESVRVVTKGHGRREIRTMTVSSLLKGYCDWPGMEQVFQLERQRDLLAEGKVTREVVYGLTSLSRAQAGPRTLLAFTRTYWGIENGLHHRRDVTFKEDATRLTQGSAGRVMAILNTLVIGLLRYLGYTNIAQARRFYDADPSLAIRLVTTVPRRL